MNETEWWRTLAMERGRQLDMLRRRILGAIDSVPDEHVRAFISSLDATRPQWLRDLDMTTHNGSEPGEIEAILDDLWRRVAADTPP